MIEHKFTFRTLELLGMGGKIINIIKLIYTKFTINTGVKQGCLISALLFIAAAEILPILIHNSHFDKLTALDKQITINQLADDIHIFEKRLSSP